uniref:Uncharacterized protein n=1 Tax=Myoviridae sp. ctHaT25 TaxID=2826635 RepID=A0A8S5NA90_9CAUD|nr:MAG TPA: hypothetical protein [Myoviridae sp. ctHaT25]
MFAKTKEIMSEDRLSRLSHINRANELPQPRKSHI